MTKHLKKLEKLSSRIRECEVEMQNLKTLPYYTIFKQQAQQQKDLEHAGQRLEKLRESAMAFMATPFGAALTIISALLSPIIEYLTNTEEGIGKVTAITRPLQSVFEALTGVFQDVSKYLFEAFTNPKKKPSRPIQLCKAEPHQPFYGLWYYFRRHYENGF